MVRGPLIIAVLVGMVGVGASGSARAADVQPQDSDIEVAKAHYRTGELYYGQHKFLDAAKEFEEAYRLSGRSELLYNMGKSYDGAEDLRGALDVYRRFLDTVKDSPDREFCQRRYSELKLLIARLDIHSSVDGATVVLDGTRLGTAPLAQPLVEVNPGEHALEISAEGYATYRMQLKLERAQTQKIDARLVSLVKVIRIEEKHVPIYKRWYLWTAVGVVVAGGVVTGAVLGARAANQISGPSLQLETVK